MCIYIYSILQYNLASGLYEYSGSICFSHFPFMSNTSVEVSLIFVLALNLIKCKPARDKLVFMLLLPASHSLSSREPKTKDLCTLDRAIVFFWWLMSVDQETELSVFSVALLPVFFLYSTGFILLMHFDDEESLLQATLNLSVQDCYDITC